MITAPIGTPPRTRAAAIDQLLAALPDWSATTGRLSELVADQLGMGSTDLQCLHFLNQHGAASPTELASRVGRTTGAVTRMIDRLERAGYVSRQPSPTDRRGVRVQATQQGLDRIATHFEELAERTREDLAGRRLDELNLLLWFVQISTERSGAQLRALLDAH